MSSLDNLPGANPYPWGPYDDTISESKGRKRKGSGTAFLESSIHQGQMSNGAARILKKLLPDLADKAEDTVYPAMSSNLLGKIVPIAIHSAQSEDEVLRLAKDGRISLFASMLKLIDDVSPAAVPNKTMVRSCVLTIRPGSIPATMDAKDVVMAALYFLSRDNRSSSNMFLELPLVKVVGTMDDLEKRSYERAGSWSMNDEFLRKIGVLETVFMESAASWQHLPRDRMLPTIPKEDARLLLYKGNVPTSATPKAKKVGGPKRKSMSSPGPTDMSDTQMAAFASDSW